ncbi:MAG: glycoside hydrolase family 65 protein [Pseudomonadota bacterium]
MLRARLVLPEDLFPCDPWAIETCRFSGEFVHEAETVFALANGYLGLRGSHEEDHPVFEPGTYLNGFYELRSIVYGEKAYGFPSVGQTMLNCPDGKILKLYVDGEPFDVDARELDHYRRRLDLRRGLLERELVWSHPNGKRIHYRTLRLVSFTQRHLACLDAELWIEGGCGEVTIASELGRSKPMTEPLDPEDPRLGAQLGDRALRPLGHSAEGCRAITCFRTERSGAVLACGMDHVVEGEVDWSSEVTASDTVARVTLRATLEPEQRFRVTKYLAYHHSRARDADELGRLAGWTLDAAKQAGLGELIRRQEATVGAFWASADVEVEDENPRAQQVIRWNLFQLLQASYCVDGAGIGARGLTGQTYEGHYFWDTEIYVLPFLIYTNPRIARGLLEFRHSKLDKARRRAKELGHQGALFPWRTINGDEASAYYAASTAQYHINADIAYAIRKYVEVTGDVDFVRDFGAEILVETARLWCSLGYYNPQRGDQFCIAGVTGPDEYTAIVNNNYFTNLMAQENLRYAAATVRKMLADEDPASRRLVRATGLDEHEIAAWEEAAARMFLPYDPVRGIHLQDDSFVDKPVWDFANTPADNYPLLLHYHPLNLYRHQVIKQADTMLAMFLLDHEFPDTDKRRNFEYYDPLTTHDSSLSVCVQSIIANRIGESDKAYEYFRFAATMDLSDIGGNVKNGAHIASIGGTWLALVYGFGGLHDWGGLIAFEPRLPRQWSRLAFNLRFKGARLRVEVTHDRTTYELVEGEVAHFEHWGTPVTLDAGRSEVTLPYPKGEERAGKVPDS